MVTVQYYIEGLTSILYKNTSFDFNSVPIVDLRILNTLDEFVASENSV